LILSGDIHNTQLAQSDSLFGNNPTTTTTTTTTKTITIHCYKHQQTNKQSLLNTKQRSIGNNVLELTSSPFAQRGGPHAIYCTTRNARHAPNEGLIWFVLFLFCLFCLFVWLFVCLFGCLFVCFVVVVVDKIRLGAFLAPISALSTSKFTTTNQSLCYARKLRTQLKQTAKTHRVFIVVECSFGAENEAIATTLWRPFRAAPLLSRVDRCCSQNNFDQLLSSSHRLHLSTTSSSTTTTTTTSCATTELSGAFSDSDYFTPEMLAETAGYDRVVEQEVGLASDAIDAAYLNNDGGTLMSVLC
jgi:hypothetical protein